VRGEGRRKRCLVVDCEVLASKYNFVLSSLTVFRDMN
jgi:hypothetical protein